MRITVYQIKLVHTIIFWILSACVLYALFAAVADRIDLWTWIAVGLIVVEGIALAVAGWTCPLTILAERRGAARGSVADIFLPKWFADRIFPICGTMYAIAVAIIFCFACSGGEHLMSINALEGLERLREGNRRFVAGMRTEGGLDSDVRRAALVGGQDPFAIVLGCSDSRVPVEIVFDQGVGDLFVIRVAGNIVAPSQIGSVEFAAERFGARLVVVLGHSQCGAVQATVEAVRCPGNLQSRNLHSIVDRIRPSVEGLLAADPAKDTDALVHETVRTHVRVSADHLRHGSELLERLIERDGLLVLGAEYSLESGIVDVFDGLPE